MATTTYERPSGQSIGRSGKTRRLYELEEKRDAAIQAAGKELGSVLGHTISQYWTHTMPEELLSVLEGFDPNAAALAADAYLQKHS